MHTYIHIHTQVYYEWINKKNQKNAYGVHVHIDTYICTIHVHIHTCTCIVHVHTYTYTGVLMNELKPYKLYNYSEPSMLHII